MGIAEQVHAPALVASPQRVTLAWVGATESGVHHDAAAIVDGVQTPVVMLPLPPTAPRASRLFPAAGEFNTHLLWLDIDENGVLQVFTAVVDESLGVFRGPLPVSEDGATCFGAFRNVDGSVQVVWHGGGANQPALYSGTIEPTGLVLRRQRIHAGGGCPAAVETFEGRYLLWPEDGTLYSARFLNGFVDDAQPAGDMPTLRGGDRLRGVRGGSDGERLYAFYNITRADGTDETWFASGLPGEAWSEPRQLTAIPDENALFETTLNTGRTRAAVEGVGGITAAWAAPLEGVTGVLPVAIEADESALAVIYLRGGEVVGYQRVTETRPLLGPPALHIDQDRHLYLTWSEPTDIGAARLQITSTRALLD